MSSVSIIVLCASALYVQTIYAQCLRGPAPALWEPTPAPILRGPAPGPILYEPAYAPALWEPAPAPILYEPAYAPALWGPAPAPILYEPALAPALWEPAPAPIALAPRCSGVNYDNIITSNLASVSGGSLGVTTYSLYSPNGISVLSENEISGVVEVVGNLPVLAGVAVDGVLPTTGTAGTIYNCGNGDVGIASEYIAAAGIDAVGYGPSYGPLYGPSYGPSYSPGYGPVFGPGYGPSYGPSYRPGYSAVPAANAAATAAANTVAANAAATAAFGRGVYAHGPFTAPAFETAPWRCY